MAKQNSAWNRTRVSNKRGIESSLQWVRENGDAGPVQLLQKLIVDMRNLAVPAQQAARSELLALWAGQSAGIAQYPDATTLLQSLINGVSEKLA